MTNKYSECKGCVNEHTCKYYNKYSTCRYSNKNRNDTKNFYLNRFMKVV